MTSPSSPKTLGRAYAFKFLFGLFTPKFEEKREQLIQSPDFEQELEQTLKDFDSSYFEPDDEHLLNQMLAPNVQSFAKKLIKDVLTRESQLKDKIASALKKWKLSQLDKVDLTILLMATAELEDSDQTPAKVIINEAIELSKQYGSKESGSFINGILDTISKR